MPYSITKNPIIYISAQSRNLTVHIILLPHIPSINSTPEPTRKPCPTLKISHNTPNRQISTCYARNGEFHYNIRISFSVVLIQGLRTLLFYKNDKKTAPIADDERSRKIYQLILLFQTSNNMSGRAIFNSCPT